VDRLLVLGGRVGEGLGALREREYRLLFGATLTTSLGGAVGTIALAFAVLTSPPRPSGSSSPPCARARAPRSFFVCPALLARMRIAPRVGAQGERFLHELRAGWREFTARTWLCSTVLLFGIGNVFFMFMQVLGPAVAKERSGGAGAWAAILTVAGIGAIAGGVAAMRRRPGRPLVACILWPLAVCRSSRPWPPARRRGRSAPR
jgi:hypothetical protein